MERIQDLTCCCCGNGARGRQWYNRDRGYGLCGRCAVWIKSRGKEPPDEMERNYGKAGFHYFPDTEA